MKSLGRGWKDWEEKMKGLGSGWKDWEDDGKARKRIKSLHRKRTERLGWRDHRLEREWKERLGSGKYKERERTSQKDGKNDENGGWKHWERGG
jgi:hypothetical protein